MEGELGSGVYLVFSECTDLAREAEFNEWYDLKHIPDMLGSGLVSGAARYENTSTREGEAKYMVIYTIYGPELESVPDAVKHCVEDWRNQGRMHPSIKVIKRGLWRSLRPSWTNVEISKDKVTGLMIGETYCKDPAREAEFNNWYDSIHIPDLFSTGLFQTAYRFESCSSMTGESRYLALYETAADNPIHAAEEIQKVHNPKWREAGRGSDLLRSPWYGIFRPL